MVKCSEYLRGFLKNYSYIGQDNPSLTKGGRGEKIMHTHRHTENLLSTSASTLHVLGKKLKLPKYHVFVLTLNHNIEML